MKKLLLFVTLLFLCVGVSAQPKTKNRIDRYWNERSGYLNVSYVNQKLKTEVRNKNIDLLKNNWGVAVSYGRSFYLHNKPIADMIKIGFDWTWLDINAVGYSMDEGYFSGGDNFGNLFQGELGMQFGPSVSVNPVDDLKVSVYAHVTPTYAVFYQSDLETTFGGYETFFNMGASLSWQLISVGLEWRRGNGCFKSFDGEGSYLFGISDKVAETVGSNLVSDKIITNGWRFYIGFRF